VKLVPVLLIMKNDYSNSKANTLVVVFMLDTATAMLCAS